MDKRYTGIEVPPLYSENVFDLINAVSDAMQDSGEVGADIVASFHSEVAEVRDSGGDFDDIFEVCQNYVDVH